MSVICWIYHRGFLRVGGNCMYTAARQRVSKSEEHGHPGARIGKSEYVVESVVLKMTMAFDYAHIGRGFVLVV